MIASISKKEWIVIVSMVLVKLLLHFLTNTNYDLHRDTFLYYSLSQNLDWGYASVPPLIGLIANISILFFGHSAFALNFFPALVGGISIILISIIIKELGGNIFAILIASLAFILSPSYLRSNSLMQPVAFDQFFWLLSAYFMVKLINSQQTRYWLYLMSVWAIGFMNKYLIAVFALSFILALFFTRHRKLIISRHFLFGVIIGFIIILPNIIWQYNHNWAAFHHLSELSENQLVNVSAVGFLIDQLIMNLPGLIVWITGLVVFLFYKEEGNFKVLAITFLFVLAILLLTHGKSYYTLGAYTLMLALGGYAVEKYYSRFMKKAGLAYIVILALPVLPFSLPILDFPTLEKYSAPMAEFTNRWEDGKKHRLPQDYADMTGWKELSDIVISVYSSLTPAEKMECNIYAENYGQAGAIYYYGKKYNLPRPISFSDNFLLWAPDTLDKKNLIYVNDEVGDIKFLFKKYELKGTVNDPYFRENGLMVFYCTEPSDDFKYFYSKKVKELKKVYTR